MVHAASGDYAEFGYLSVTGKAGLTPQLLLDPLATGKTTEEDVNAAMGGMLAASVVQASRIIPSRSYRTRIRLTLS